jgi:hypothetical protein
MSDSNLDRCYITATEAFAAFKTHAVSPVELLKAIIARCESRAGWPTIQRASRLSPEPIRNSVTTNERCTPANTPWADGLRAGIQVTTAAAAK